MDIDSINITVLSSTKLPDYIKAEFEKELKQFANYYLVRNYIKYNTLTVSIDEKHKVGE